MLCRVVPMWSASSCWDHWRRFRSSISRVRAAFFSAISLLFSSNQQSGTDGTLPGTYDIAFTKNCTLYFWLTQGYLLLLFCPLRGRGGEKNERGHPAPRKGHSPLTPLSSEN